MHPLRIFSVLLAVVAIQVTFSPDALASKTKSKLHKMRWEINEAEWSAPKVELNVQFRVPVVDAIGYLAVNFDEPDRLNRLLVQVRPISKKVTELSGGVFQGRSFPAEVEVELSDLRQKMMSDITAIYGADVTKQLEAFLVQKYDSLDEGLFGPLRE